MGKHFFERNRTKKNLVLPAATVELWLDPERAPSNWDD